MEDFTTIDDDADFALSCWSGRPNSPNAARAFHFREDFFAIFHANVAFAVVVGVPLEIFSALFVIFAPTVIA